MMLESKMTLNIRPELFVAYLGLPMGLNFGVDFRITDLSHAGFLGSKVQLHQNIGCFDNAKQIIFHAHDYYIGFARAAQDKTSFLVGRLSHDFAEASSGGQGVDQHGNRFSIHLCIQIY